MRWLVSIHGERQYVYPTSEQDICIFGCKDTVTVEISSPVANATSVDVRPLAKNPEYRLESGKVKLRMTAGDRYAVEFNGAGADGALILFANPIDTEKPSPDDPDVIFYAKGKVYDTGVVNVRSNQTLYIEGGAVLNGHVQVSDASGVTIAGGGIINHQTSEEKGLGLKSVTNSTVRDITVVSASNWTTIASLCDGISFINFHSYATASLITETGVENDSLDLLGCSNVTHKGCFCCCHDDTYCIKTEKWTTAAPSENISYEDCIAWNKGGGNGFEIGYELNRNVSHVTYKDIYSIHMTDPRNGNPFRRAAVSIHCGAAGTVSDVSYENVYIEEPRVYGIHMNILKTSYNIGEGVEWGPGHIKGVKMKNVHMAFKPAYGNFLGGYDKDHRIELEIDGIYMGQNRVFSAGDAYMSVSYSDLKIL